MKRKSQIELTSIAPTQRSSTEQTTFASLASATAAIPSTGLVIGTATALIGLGIFPYAGLGDQSPERRAEQPDSGASRVATHGTNYDCQIHDHAAESAPTPTQFVDRFEQINGVHSGFRRNHAKGLGVAGSFDSNGNGVRLSKAAVFEPGRVPVIGRFSLDGGLPYVSDKPNTRRGLGLQFSTSKGELWQTAMINFPLFPVRTPEIFYERLLAFKTDPATGKPDPDKVKAFEEGHPETVEILKRITSEPQGSGFGNTTFHSLNTFLFTSAAGETIPVRWILRPMQPFEAADDAPRDKNYLFEDLIAQIHRQPLRWHLIVIVGKPGDPTNDPSIGWPPDREQVEVGTLTLDRVEAEELSAATDIVFDPLRLPAGMAPSDDPVLRVRSPIYVESHTRRVGETKQPSAITTTDVNKRE